MFIKGYNLMKTYRDPKCVQKCHGENFSLQMVENFVTLIHRVQGEANRVSKTQFNKPFLNLVKKVVILHLNEG